MALQTSILGSPFHPCLYSDVIHSCGFKSHLSADSQMYPWSGTPPHTPATVLHPPLPAQCPHLHSHRHSAHYLLTMGHLVCVIKLVLHSSPPSNSSSSVNPPSGPETWGLPFTPPFSLPLTSNPSQSHSCSASKISPVSILLALYHLAHATNASYLGNYTNLPSPHPCLL